MEFMIADISETAMNLIHVCPHEERMTHIATNGGMVSVCSTVQEMICPQTLIATGAITSLTMKEPTLTPCEHMYCTI